MLGAILGDIVGSPYEFDHNNYKHKDFPLLGEKSHFTDDTVMTVAVAQGLMAGQGDAQKTFAEVQHEMRRWGRAYPNAGYGGMFRRWLRAEHPQPYGSFGNGSAMRVAAAGWLFDTLDTTTRRLKVSDHLEILLSDTVGFIAKLPHHLIEAFQATLEELQYADLLLHVIDASDPHREAHIEVVDRLIDKLAKPGVPVLRCYNKADLVGDVSNLPIGEKNIPMCARSGIGMDELLTRIEEMIVQE